MTYGYRLPWAKGTGTNSKGIGKSNIDVKAIGEGGRSGL